MKPFFQKLWKREEFIFFILFLVVAILRLPTLQQPFENDSGSIAYHARLIARGFPLYGEHHPTHHMPGTYYLYALAFTLLGDQVQSVRIILLLWTGLTVFLIYRLGKIVVDKKTGFIAALFSAVMLSHLFIAGANTKVESFVILPQVTAVYTLMILANKPNPSWKFFLVGFFSCITFLFKANYVSPIFLTAVFILREIAPEWKQPAKWRQISAQVGWAILGFCVPAVTIIFLFAQYDSLDGFFQVFRLGLSYTTVGQDGFSSPIYLVLYPLAILAQSNIVLLISGLAGIIFFFLTIRKQDREASQEKHAHQKHKLMTYIVIWFGFCFVETGISHTFLHNYYLVFITPLSILSAWFFVKFTNDISKAINKSSAIFRKAILTLLTISGLALGILSNYPYLYHYYTQYLPGNESYGSVLEAGLPDGVYQTMRALDEISQYLDKHTEQDDTIYYWSNFMELYYLADRQSSMNIIWPLYVDAFGTKERVFDAEYILIGDMPLGFQEIPKWFEDSLKANYELEIVLYDQQLYRRIH